MKGLKILAVGLLILSVISVPVLADAHWGAGGVFLGFGAGLLTGALLAPRPVYVAPPVYPAPPAVYQPAPADASGPISAPCREWRLIDRHWENRWDPYYRTWRRVPVDRWGWVGVPCQ